MVTTTLSIRVEERAKKRLEKLAKSTGRTSSYLASEAIDAYLDINEWQVAGVRKAVATLDRGKGVDHARVKAWVASWDADKELPKPARARARSRKSEAANAL